MIMIVTGMRLPLAGLMPDLPDNPTMGADGLPRRLAG
jgi:hypothetical protein